jgi:hypothetical protein
LSLPRRRRISPQWKTVPPVRRRTSPPPSDCIVISPYRGKPYAKCQETPIVPHSLPVDSTDRKKEKGKE